MVGMMPHVASQHSSPTAPPVGVGAGSEDGSGLRTLACNAASVDTADAAMAVTHTTATHIRDRGARTISTHGCGAHGLGVRRGGGGARSAARLGDRDVGWVVVGWKGTSLWRAAREKGFIWIAGRGYPQMESQCPTSLPPPSVIAASGGLRVAPAPTRTTGALDPSWPAPVGGVFSACRQQPNTTAPRRALREGLRKGGLASLHTYGPEASVVSRRAAWRTRFQELPPSRRILLQVARQRLRPLQMYGWACVEGSTLISS